MRLRYAVVGVFVASSLGALGYGCGGDSTSALPIENFCGWIDDPNNCYRAFYLDVGQQCGSRSEQDMPHGGFRDRTMLDLCVLDGGGNVTFDGLDISQFPLGGLHVDNDGGVIPFTGVNFTINKATGEECGRGSWAGPGTWSVTIDACPPDAGGIPNFGSGGSGGAGGAGGSGGVLPPSSGCNRGGVNGTGGTSTILGGTYSMTQTGDLIDTSCPSGESHHFDDLTLEKCSKVAPLLPVAEILSDPGSTSKEGYIWFRVHYPPGDSIPASTEDLEGHPTEVVNYFFCTIPKAPFQCMDGAKNGAETDVDCGGPLDPQVPTACPARCASGQACFDNSDCANQHCDPDMSGIRHCAMDMNMGSGGGGGSASSSSSASASASSGASSSSTM